MKNMCTTVNDIVIQVDYKIELFGVLITLSNECESFPNIFQYNDTNNFYIKEIKNSFKFLETSEILNEFNKLKDKYNLHYQNPIELALSIDDNYKIKNNASEFFKKEEIICFLNKMKDFEKSIDFKSFYLKNTYLYNQWIKSVSSSFKKYNIKRKLIDYCGDKYKSLNLYLNLVAFETNGGYGFLIDNNAHYCLKAIKSDYASNNEIFLNNSPDIYLPITLHEYLHSIINPLTINYNIFNSNTNYLKKYYTKAYNNDYYIISENIVRAIVIRILVGFKENWHLEELIQKEVERGFELVPIINKKLIEYEHNRHQYSNIDSFYKEIVDDVLKKIN